MAVEQLSRQLSFLQKDSFTNIKASKKAHEMRKNYCILKDNKEEE